MTDQEKTFFTALSKDREQSATTLDKPSMRGVQQSVVEKYSDQAHFIYELLQNADDAKATTARFDLREDQLIFAHNGTKRFSVSNPDTEDVDTATGNLGDINAITSIANSNKTSESIAIGKFGVGFKAVFQYTQTPQIYDRNIFFKIERFIVPVKLGNDNSNRKPEETLFVFPFDHPDRNQKSAFDDISNKLNSLVYPILFLSNIKNISYKSPSEIGAYTKTIEMEEKFNNITAQLISLPHEYHITNTDNKSTSARQSFYFKEGRYKKIWLFSRSNGTNHTYSVGFFVDNDNVLKPFKKTAFCFFPTKEETNLNFIVHAPFLLTDSRANIKAGDLYNKKMIQCLADLAADSLVCLKKIGQNQGKALITDSILEIIPYDSSKFGEIDDRDTISFMPFHTAIKTKFKSEELLPSSDGFSTTENAYWAHFADMPDIFSNTQLADLKKEEHSKWVFTSRGRQETVRTDNQLSGYIDDITNAWYEPDAVIKLITGDFIEKQSIEWLHRFYKYISESNARQKLIKDMPIFLNQDSKAVSAFDKQEHAILFLPSDDTSGYETINNGLLTNADTKDFITKLGIKPPTLRDEIYNKILPQYKHNGIKDPNLHFKKFFNYYKQCHTEEKTKYIKSIRACEFIHYRENNVGDMRYGKASELYFPTKDLLDYFKAQPRTKFIAVDEYKISIDEKEEKLLYDFLTELGISKIPRVVNSELNRSEVLKLPYRGHSSTTGHTYVEYSIDGCDAILNSINSENTGFLWNQLLTLISKHLFLDAMKIEHHYWARVYDYIETFDSRGAIRLRTIPWLLNKNGKFLSAVEMTQETLSTDYKTDCQEAQELLNFLGIKAKPVPTPNTLTAEQIKKIRFADSFKGIPAEAIEQFRQEYISNQSQSDTNPINDITTIHNWWVSLTDSEQQAKVRRYYERLFPRISEFDITCLMKPDSQNYKSTWLTLFILAVSHTIGRTKIEQDRGFIEFLHSKRWLETMIASDNVNEWVDIFVEYMENPSSNQEYMQWMKLFFIFYIIRKHLDDYITIFKGVNNRQYPFSMDIILKPSSDPELRGKDIKAPSAKRIFRIGASMIIREVLRYEKVPTKYASEHAFMPKDSTLRSVFGNTNADTSAQIYKELNRKLYNFGKYYDIPILIYNYFPEEH